MNIDFRLAFCMIALFSCLQVLCNPEQNNTKIIPWSWSKGEPIWKEGEPLPPEGKALVAICARNWGVLEREVSDPSNIRGLSSVAGHAWIEFVNNIGNIKSIGSALLRK